MHRHDIRARWCSQSAGWVQEPTLSSSTLHICPGIVSGGKKYNAIMHGCCKNPSEHMDVHGSWRGGSVGKGTCSQVQFPRSTGQEERTDYYEVSSDLGRSALICTHTHKQINTINYLNGFEHVLRIPRHYGYSIRDDGGREKLDKHWCPCKLRDREQAWLNHTLTTIRTSPHGGTACFSKTDQVHSTTA